MNGQTSHSRDFGFILGLLTGAVVGVGVALWLAPNAAGEARGRVATSARRLRDDLKSKSDGFRDQVADVVARTAHDVEEFAAVAVKTDRKR
jgi:gas vesicle protein